MNGNCCNESKNIEILAEQNSSKKGGLVSVPERPYTIFKTNINSMKQQSISMKSGTMIWLFQLGSFILISCSMVGSSKRFKSIGQKSKTEKETNIY